MRISVSSACAVTAFVTVAILIGYFYLSASQQLRGLPHIERTGIVLHVTDGDTIVLEGGEKIRLVGINAPEVWPSEEPGGREAKEFVENLLPPGTQVGLNVDDLNPRDRYGRTLAVVYVKIGGVWTNLNAHVLNSGFAEILETSPSEFNPHEWTRATAPTQETLPAVSPIGVQVAVGVAPLAAAIAVGMKRYYQCRLNRPRYSHR